MLIATAISTWKATPIYSATIKLQIDPEPTNVLLPFKDAIDPGSTYAQRQEYLQTQFKVLESETLAGRVVRALDLGIYEISEKGNVILQKLADLNTALTTVQTERIQRESAWHIVQQAGPGDFPDAVELITSHETKSLMSEAYRNLRASCRRWSTG